MRSAEDTIAALATPLGEGGIGVLRMSGNAAIEIAQKIFRRMKSSSPTVVGGGSMDPLPEAAGDDLLTAPSHTCHYGTIHEGSDIIDHVLLTVFCAPHSYTGENVVEISAHGSPLILQKILALCAAEGARLAGPGEFTERAFLNGKMDLTQAEAVAELIRAKTDKTLAAARAQLEGSLSRQVRALRDTILPLLAHIEIGLDHADEDHDFLKREELGRTCLSLTQKIETILSSAQTGKVLREGFRVALLGRPNVGKSSLMNALLQEDRAIVTPIAGTTRDTLEETLHLRGLPVVLTDTAGLRGETHDPIEKLGMERTRQSLENADLVIGLFDGSEPITPEDRQVIAEASAKPHLWVLNKCDLPARLPADTLGSFNGGGRIIALSAKTGAGMNELRDAMERQALSQSATAGEAEWLLNARHAAALHRASEALAMAARGAGDGSPEECVALELKTALDALGEIIGETSTEDLLGEIFSRFCVGK